MSAKKSSDVEEIAQVLGMKTSEVVDVEQVADGTLAKTHDGNWTLIRDDGVLEFLGQDLGVDRAEKAITEEASKKPAPKGRGQA